MCRWVLQVGWIDYVPAYCGNGNSHNVSCSNLSLHCHKHPWEWALYKWLAKNASDKLCIWRYVNELHVGWVIGRHVDDYNNYKHNYIMKNYNYEIFNNITRHFRPELIFTQEATFKCDMKSGNIPHPVPLIADQVSSLFLVRCFEDPVHGKGAAVLSWSWMFDLDDAHEVHVTGSARNRQTLLGKYGRVILKPFCRWTRSYHNAMHWVSESWSFEELCLVR